MEWDYGASVIPCFVCASADWTGGHCILSYSLFIAATQRYTLSDIVSEKFGSNHSLQYSLQYNIFIAIIQPEESYIYILLGTFYEMSSTAEKVRGYGIWLLLQLFCVPFWIIYPGSLCKLE